MRRPAEVELASLVPASPSAVWARVSTLDGINHELMPLLRLGGPPGARLDAADVPIGRVWHRCPLLLAGRIPVGRSDLTLVSVQAGRGFLERSPMTGMRLWEHERLLEEHADGCVVRDRLRARTRVPFPTGVVEAVVRALFRHRHRRLARSFGRAP